MSRRELIEYLKGEWPGISEGTQERIGDFWEELAAENERQNLTRLISPREFVDGHALDVRFLLESGLVSFPAMDLGSGGGVPGLLAAIVREDSWVLVDSESRKAEFLARMVERFGLSGRVSVFCGRGEAFLEDQKVESVVSRAVGPVERIYRWLRPCSTWNNLVLLKGPGWEEEWARFQGEKFRHELKNAPIFDYEVGPERKKRRIVRLIRVPRGTKG